MSAFYDVAPISPDRNVWGNPFLETSWSPIDFADGRAVTMQLSAADIRFCAVTPVTMICTGERCFAYRSIILQKRVQPNGDDETEGVSE